MAGKKAKNKAAVKSKKIVAKSTKPKAKPASKRPTIKIGKSSKLFTKTELYRAIAEGTELNKKQVTAVFDKLNEIIALHLRGPEKFVMPGLLKAVVKKVPARPARKGINPFTKEEIVFKAKPASKKVKVIALRGLKEMVC